jgi:putative tryptophan/tyrosine transport system substrate-binding protein
MRRRDFIALIGAATTWPPTARAQRPAMPIIGFLDPTSLEKYKPFVLAFHDGLREVGFLESTNVVIEYRWAEGHYDRLPGLAADLARLPVAVIVATGITATRAAVAATATIPIVFNTGGDPVKFGLVHSLNKPGGHVTGVASLGKTLVAKHLELIHEIIPKGDTLVFVVNPINAVAALDTGDVQTAAGSLGQRLIVVNASTENDINAAFKSAVERRASALLMQLDPFFQSRQDQFVSLATRLGIPMVSYWRDFASAGGLMSYGTSLSDALRLVGTYTGRILKGEKPSDLPVQESVKIEFVINLRTAKSLGLNVPATLLARADEVIE